MLITDRPSVLNINIRLAEPHETELVRKLDDMVFPEQSMELQRAPANELEEGVRTKDVYLFELDNRAIAYLHVNRTDSRWIYLAGFGVLPELQNQGIGTAIASLMRPILDEAEDKLPIYTVTSPWNTRLLRLLFNLRFAGRWVLLDHFGPGRHRIGCQPLRAASGETEPRTARQVPLEDIYALDRLLATGWVIRGLHRKQAGVFFELVAESGDSFLACPRPLSPGHAEA